ncbi:flagellar motor stator protein MotA [Pueribacillus sp. YX66]|uniref:flagellar motor stator protein MotA n=1 Tax=Pueribacillus sp. YX66 TaxID=3229242 RepID=UPI00358CEF73
MDRTSLIGILFGIIAVGVGMALKGISPLVIFNPAAVIIIFLGTIASVTIGFPGKELKKIPKLFKVIFSEQKVPQIKDLIPLFMEWASLARKEGILFLEGRVGEVEDPFLRNGMKLVIDGQSPEFIRDVMNEQLNALEERHEAGAQIFSQAGTYAPTLGVLGAVIGLIAALGNIANFDILGEAIAAAFIATLLGIFSGYVLWHPFANKLRRKSKEEIRIREIMIEGILSIQNGQSPRAIQEKLASYLPLNESASLLKEGEEYGKKQEAS